MWQQAGEELSQMITTQQAKKLFQDWYPIIQDTVNSAYFNTLIHKLEHEYKTCTVYPSRKQVFRAFNKTPFYETKVVILGQDPYYNGAGNGLAFANNDSVLSLSPSLEVIRKKVEDSIYCGFKVDFDVTLESWAEQGILLLNTALTVQKDQPGSHTKMWNGFTTSVIRALNRKTSGMIFVLWGGHAKYYKKYIDPAKHYILEAEHPVFSKYKNKDWDCDHFNEINEIITKHDLNGSINW